MTLVCVLTECRMIAALILEPWVLRDAVELETDDFTNLRCRAVFAAIRNLQARGARICMTAIVDELVSTDARNGTTVADKAGCVFLGDLFLATAMYGNPVLWEHDLWYLRELANRRRSAIALAEVA